MSRKSRTAWRGNVGQHTVSNNSEKHEHRGSQFVKIILSKTIYMHI